MHTISVRLNDGSGARLGGLNVAELSGSAMELMANWMRQYSDLPMDLADASRLWMAQEHGLRNIESLEYLLDA